MIASQFYELFLCRRVNLNWLLCCVGRGVDPSRLDCTHETKCLAVFWYPSPSPSMYLIIIIKTPEFYAVQTTGRLHVHLLSHQPVLVVDHGQHMMVLVLVFELQWSIGLELFLNPLQQLL